MILRIYSNYLHRVNWQFISLLLIALTFALPFKASNLFLVFAAIVWLLSGNVVGKLKTAFSTPSYWPVFTFFVLHVLALFYTENSSAGLFAIEKKLPLLVLPLIIYSSELSKPQRKIILHYFAWAMATISFVLINRVVFISITQKDCSSCFYHSFTSVIGLHAIYFSYFSFFSILILIHTILDKNHFYLRSFKTYLYVLAVVILIVATILAASKIVISTFIVLIPFFIINIASKHKYKAITLSLLLIISGLIMVYSFDTIQERFSRIYSNEGFSSLAIVGTSEKLTNDEKRELTGLSLRVLLIKLGMYEVQQDNVFWLGYGPGDTQNTLNKVYLRHNMAPNWFEDYNLHNQYFQTFLELGISGLLFLFAILLTALIYSLKYQSHLLLFFTLLICMAFTTEVALAANKGIVFFSFFYALFTLNVIDNK